MVTLVMVPGLMSDGRLFAPQIAALSDRVAIHVVDVTSGESIGAIAGDALARAPERFALCGISMGGYVCMEVFRQTPDRVDRLALIDTNARADSEAARQSRLELLDLAARGGYPEVIERLLPRMLHSDRLGDPALTGVVRAMAEAVGPDGFERQERAIIDRVDSRPLLPEIACPTLVLCGREDALTPLELHLEMSAAIPDATLVVLPHCGHLSTLERPQAVTEQLENWLFDGLARTPT